ncbi:MAG: hypothetical protein P1U56_25785 [Saprospiraceae bacterium]|nr:hypothetical protein [Saprospiraceae bacterium]
MREMMKYGFINTNRIVCLFAVVFCLICLSCNKKDNYQISDVKHLINIQNEFDREIVSAILFSYSKKDSLNESYIRSEFERWKSIKDNKPRTAREVDYMRIVSTYKRVGFSDELDFLLRNTFDISSDTLDFEGYLTASYFGVGMFEDAALLKSRRKNRSRKDLHGFAKCIRNIFVVKGYDRAEVILDSLILISSIDSIDKIWSNVPIEVQYSIFQGIHYEVPLNSLEGKDIIRIEKYIEDFPNSKYTSLANYIIKRKSSFSFKVENQIDLFEDIILFSEGYRYWKSIEWNANNLSDDMKSEYSIKSYEYAINCFTTFMNKYPNHRQADDAAYYNAELLFFNKKYPESISNLKQIKKYGNKSRSFIESAKWLKYDIAKEIDPIEGLQIFNYFDEPGIVFLLLNRLNASNRIDEIVKIISRWNQFEEIKKSKLKSTNRSDILFEKFVNDIYTIYPKEELSVISSKINDENKNCIIDSILVERQSIRNYSIKSEYDYRNSNFLPSSISKSEYLKIRGELLNEKECSKIISTIDKLQKLNRKNNPKNNYLGDHRGADLILGALEYMNSKKCDAKNDFKDYMKIIVLSSFIGKYYYSTHLNDMPELIIIENLVNKFNVRYPSSKYLGKLYAVLISLKLGILKENEDGEILAQAFLDKFGDSDYADDILYELATKSYFNDNKKELYFKLLINQYPKSKFSKLASKHLDEINSFKYEDLNLYYHSDFRTRYHIVVASFNKHFKAETITKEFINNGFSNSKILISGEKFRVIIDSFQSRRQAEDFLRENKETFLNEGWILEY